MSLQTRLGTLISAIGADIKALKELTPTILSTASTVSDSEESNKAVEWYYSDTNLIGKLVTIVPIVNATIQDRGEVWLRARSRTGGASQTLKLLDSDGKSDLLYGWGPWTNLAYSANWSTLAGQQAGQYRKSLDGTRLQLRGTPTITGATLVLAGANKTIAVLPVGARPPAPSFRMVRILAGGTTDTVVLLGVGSGGAIDLWNELTGRSLTYGSGTYLMLDGIEISLEA